MLYYAHKILVTETKKANVIQRHVLHFPHHLRPNPQQKKKKKLEVVTCHKKCNTYYHWGLRLRETAVGGWTLKQLGFFYNCIVPIRFLPWKIWVAFPRESQL